MNLNEPAPDFSLPDLDGRLYALRNFRGAPVILNFWSADCPHCARTDPVILSAARRGPDSIAVVAIASNRNETDAQLGEAARRSGLSLVLRDTDQKVADAFDALTTPHIFLLDGDGILRYRGAVDPVGWKQGGSQRGFLDEAVQALLKQQVPAVQESPPFGCAIIRYI